MSPKIEDKSSSYEALEQRIAEKWRAEGRFRIHWCNDWDGMLIHAEMPEAECCTCEFDAGGAASIAT